MAQLENRIKSDVEKLIPSHKHASFSQEAPMNRESYRIRPTPRNWTVGRGQKYRIDQDDIKRMFPRSMASGLEEAYLSGTVLWTHTSEARTHDYPGSETDDVDGVEDYLVLEVIDGGKETDIKINSDSLARKWFGTSRDILEAEFTEHFEKNGTFESDWSEEPPEPDHEEDDERPRHRSLASRVVRRFVFGDSANPIFLPQDLKGTPPVHPEGTDINYWTWDVQGTPFAEMYIGKGRKPAWYHRFPSEASRDKYIQDAVDLRRTQMEAVLKRRQDRQQYQHAIKEGDIFVSSWGYDQTNVDYYQVTRVIGKAVEIREIGAKLVGEGGGPQENVVPVPGSFEGPPMRKIPGVYRGEPILRMTSYSSARPWDGYPQSQTGAGYGH